MWTFISISCVCVAIAMKLDRLRRTTSFSSGLWQCVGGWDMNVLILLRSLTCDPVLSSQRWGLAVVAPSQRERTTRYRKGGAVKDPDKLFTDRQMNVVTSCNLCRVISFILLSCWL